jgi:hypothetical protein
MPHQLSDGVGPSLGTCQQGRKVKFFYMEGDAQNRKSVVHGVFRVKGEAIIVRAFPNSKMIMIINFNQYEPFYLSKELIFTSCGLWRFLVCNIYGNPSYLILTIVLQFAILWKVSF